MPPGAGNLGNGPAASRPTGVKWGGGGTREESGAVARERLDAAAGDRGDDGVDGAGDAIGGPGGDADDGVDEAANDGKLVGNGVHDRFSFTGLVPLLVMTLAAPSLLQKRKLENIRTLPADSDQG